MFTAEMPQGIPRQAPEMALIDDFGGRMDLTTRYPCPMIPSPLTAPSRLRGCRGFRLRLKHYIAGLR